MLRVSAIESALPDDLRRTFRDHPILAITAGALVGFYLGRSHGREILSALVGVGLTAGASSVRRMLGVAPEPRRAARAR
jgi:uncharacterized membrane protein YebE (DUF533 family)